MVCDIQTDAVSFYHRMSPQLHLYEYVNMLTRSIIPANSDQLTHSVLGSTFSLCVNMSGCILCMYSVQIEMAGCHDGRKQVDFIIIASE